MVTLEQDATFLGDRLAGAIEAALPGWVERSVRRRLDGAEIGPEKTAAALGESAEAGRRAGADVGAAVRRLLAADIDEQATTPLALVRGAVRYPTEVLRRAGVAPAERDRVQAHLLPDDVYDLSPATFADVDPSLTEPGIAWGAAKAYAHIRRHGGGREARR